MKFFTISINEDTWNVYLTEDEDHVVGDEDEAAHTSILNKEIFFRRSQVNMLNVLHEVWHVYFLYCYLDDTTDMSIGDIEEVSARLFSDRWKKMVEKSELIYNKLVELRDEN